MFMRDIFQWAVVVDRKAVFGERGTENCLCNYAKQVGYRVHVKCWNFSAFLGTGCDPQLKLKKTLKIQMGKGKIWMGKLFNKYSYKKAKQSYKYLVEITEKEDLKSCMCFDNNKRKLLVWYTLLSSQLSLIFSLLNMLLIYGSFRSCLNPIWLWGSIPSKHGNNSTWNN